ncbi:MAG: autotransporter domain-containing protein [Pseudomonadota bacterium]
MTNNKKLLKGLLAGASALTVVMGSANIASAAAQAIGAAQVDINSNPGGAGWTGGGPHAADWIQFDNAASALRVNINNAVVLGFDTVQSGAAPAVIIRNSAAGPRSLTVGSISGANTLDTIMFEVGKASAAGVLTLNGTGYALVPTNTYDKLGVVDLTNNGTMNVAMAAGAVTFDAGTDIRGAGTLNINSANGDVTFDGAVGAGTVLTAVNIQSAANKTIFNDDVSATTVNFTADGEVNLAAGKNITGDITAAVNNNGTLAVADGNSTITGDIGVAGVAGAAGVALKKLSFAGTTAGAVTNVLVIDGEILGLNELDITADGIVEINNDATIDVVKFNNATSQLNLTGVNGTLTGKIVANAAGDGIINVLANSKVIGDIGATGKDISLIEIDGAKILTAQGNVYSDEITLIDATSKLVIGSATNDITLSTTNSIDGAAANEGIISIVGAQGVTVTGALGKGNSLAEINLNNTGAKGIAFNDVVQTQALALNAAHTAPVTFAGNTTIANQVDFTAGGQSLIFKATPTLTGGADFAGHDATITINQANGVGTAGAIVNTGATGHGTLIFGADQTLNRAIGSAASSLKLVNAGAHDITLGVNTIHAKTITAKTLKLDNAASNLAPVAGNTINANIEFGDAASKFTIPDATVSFTGDITAAAGGNGVYEVSGDRNFNGAIGVAGSNIAKLDLKTADIFTFKNANVYADSIEVRGGATISINDPASPADINFGKITANNLTLDLGQNTAVLTNGAVLTGNAELKLKIMGTTGADFGFINVTGGNLDAAGVNNLNIEITDADASVKGTTFEIIKLNGGTIAMNQAAVFKCTDHLKTVDFKYDPTNRTITAVLDVQALAAAAAGVTVANPTLRGAADEIFDKDNSGDAANTAEALANMDVDTRTKAVADLSHGTQEATGQVITGVVGGAMAGMTTRLGNFGYDSNTGMPLTPGRDTFGRPVVPEGGHASSSSSQEVASRSGGGVAAGDVFTLAKIGAWASGFGGVGVQKKLSTAKSGYKSTMGGGSIGVDSKLNDNIITGLAVTYADITVKHRDTKKGDSTKAPTWIASAYGLYDFGNNWFTRGVLSYANTKITSKDKRQLTQTTTGVAKSSYTSQSGSLDIGAGYRHAINRAVNVTPTASLQYTYTKDGGYTETGAGNQNLTSKKKDFSNLSATVGASLGTYYAVKDYHVMPELHGSVQQYLGGKKAVVTTSMQGQARAFVNKSTPTKTSYNLGTSVAIKTGAFEFGVGYDANLAKKYVGHQGFVKVRVDF